MEKNVRIEEDIIEVKEESRLTTLDNPYNPFTHWDEWFAFDASKGYHTCAFLQRVAEVGQDEELIDSDPSLAKERAMDEIIKYNILGLYIKVTADSWKDRTKIGETILADAGISI
jgi:hypothetical protein